MVINVKSENEFLKKLCKKEREQNAGLRWFTGLIQLVLLMFQSLAQSLSQKACEIVQAGRQSAWLKYCSWWSEAMQLGIATKMVPPSLCWTSTPSSPQEVVVQQHLADNRPGKSTVERQKLE